MGISALYVQFAPVSLDKPPAANLRNLTLIRNIFRLVSWWGADGRREAARDIYTFCIIINLARRQGDIVSPESVINTKCCHVTLIVTEITTHLSSACHHPTTVGEGSLPAPSHLPSPSQSFTWLHLRDQKAELSLDAWAPLVVTLSDCQARIRVSNSSGSSNNDKCVTILISQYLGCRIH